MCRPFYYKTPGADPRAGDTKTAFPIGVCQYDPDTLDLCAGLRKKMPLYQMSEK